VRLGTRLVLLAAVTGGSLVVWPAVERHQERQLAALRASEEQPPAAARPAAPAPVAREEGPAPAPSDRTYYRYLDASGSLHYVDSLERVPEAFRESAKPMGMSGGSRQSEAPQLTRAEPAPPPRRRYAEPAAQPPARRAPARAAGVVVYSTSWCGWCRKTIAWLDEQGVEYENRDIEKNPAWREELIDKTGGTSIPVVEIGGELIHGFQPGRMGDLL
jgi:glutaredoxin